MFRVLLVLACAAMPSLASAGLFGPSNYHECVLKNLKGVSSDVGARMVAAACAKQFPAKKPAERPIPKTSPAAPSGAAQAPADPTGRFTDIRLDPAK